MCGYFTHVTCFRYSTCRYNRSRLNERVSQLNINPAQQRAPVPITFPPPPSLVTSMAPPLCTDSVDTTVQKTVKYTEPPENAATYSTAPPSRKAPSLRTPEVESPETAATYSTAPPSHKAPSLRTPEVELDLFIPIESEFEFDHTYPPTPEWGDVASAGEAPMDCTRPVDTSAATSNAAQTSSRESSADDAVEAVYVPHYGEVAVAQSSGEVTVRLADEPVPLADEPMPLSDEPVHLSEEPEVPLHSNMVAAYKGFLCKAPLCQQLRENCFASIHSLQHHFTEFHELKAERITCLECFDKNKKTFPKWSAFWRHNKQKHRNNAKGSSFTMDNNFYTSPGTMPSPEAVTPDFNEIIMPRCNRTRLLDAVKDARARNRAEALEHRSAEIRAAHPNQFLWTKDTAPANAVGIRPPAAAASNKCWLNINPAQQRAPVPITFPPPPPLMSIVTSMAPPLRTVDNVVNYQETRRLIRSAPPEIYKKTAPPAAK